MNRKIKTIVLVITVLVLFAGTSPFLKKEIARLFNKKTVADRLLEFGPRVEAQLRPVFLKHNISFPPKHITLVILKRDKKVFLYAGRNENETQLIKMYPILAASGTAGPKLKDGDKQVPEGVYKIESLNPNSRFHLALRVNYPNDFDKKMALKDGRVALGTDIMIHGNQRSIGCVAIGDAAIEELFVLAAMSDYSSWRLVFAPLDLRIEARPTEKPLPDWVSELDQQLLREFLTLQ